MGNAVIDGPYGVWSGLSTQNYVEKRRSAAILGLPPSPRGVDGGGNRRQSKLVQKSSRICDVPQKNLLTR